MNLRDLPLLGQGLLAQGDDWQVHLVRPGEPLFTAILDGRQAVSCGPVTDAIDGHSTHYALTQGGTLQVWFRVTRAHQGPLDCEGAYPPELVEAFRPVLASTSRLGRPPGPGRLRAGALKDFTPAQLEYYYILYDVVYYIVYYIVLH